MDKVRLTKITHQEATDAAHRLIRGYFSGEHIARTSIPARPDDDDVLLMDYLRQQESGIIRQPVKLSVGYELQNTNQWQEP